MNSTSNTPKPKLACEIAADRVLAGRLTEHGEGLEASASRELAPGSVIPDLVENNLRQREAVRTGIEAVLGGVAPQAGAHMRLCVRREYRAPFFAQPLLIFHPA